jgi:hypothetical protein
MRGGGWRRTVAEATSVPRSLSEHSVWPRPGEYRIEQINGPIGLRLEGTFASLRSLPVAYGYELRRAPSIH